MNRRSVQLHGVLLILTLIVAGLTWSTAGDATDATDGVVLFEAASGDATALIFRSDKTELRLEPRRDDRGRWIYGELRHEATDGEGEPKIERFKANQRAAKLFERVEPLRARRLLGVMPPEKLEEMGLAKPMGTLTVTLAGARHELALGGKPHGTRDRYARLDDGRVAVLAAALVGDLKSGSSAFMERRLLEIPRPEIARLEITLGERTLDLRQHDAARPGSAFWAVAGEDDGNDQYRAWVGKLLRLTVRSYEEADPATASGGGKGTLRLTVKATRESGTSETLKLYELTGPDGKPGFRARSTTSRMTAVVASQLSQELLGDLGGMLP